MCVDGCNRTLEFIRGIHTAILEVRQRHPDRPARILYAGCGPYATLATPLMPIFPAAQVQFTLVDIHGESIDSARAVVDKLKLIDRVTAFAAMDAGALRISPDQPPDIVLMEIMKSCLEDEPQVAIARHLLAQAAGAILLPAEIRIDLVLVNPSAEFAVADSGMIQDQVSWDRIPVGPVFVLNRNSIDAWKGNRENRLPGATLQLPDYAPERYQPMLFTTISVYENHVLRDYDSGLTCPRLLLIEGGIGPRDWIQFYYELGQHPALKAECLCGGAGPD